MSDSPPLMLKAIVPSRSNLPSPTQFKVELDDRAILLPDAKIVQHLLVTLDPSGRIAFDGVFVFNQTRRPSSLISLSLDETREFATELVAAVYAAKTSFVFAHDLKITITVVANGYRLEFARGSETFDLFLSTGVIWRVIKAIFAALDAASPIVAN